MPNLSKYKPPDVSTTGGVKKITSPRPAARALPIFTVTAVILLALHFALFWAEREGVDTGLAVNQITLLKRLFLIGATITALLALVLDNFQHRLPPEVLKALASLTTPHRQAEEYHLNLHRKELEDKYQFFFEESQTLNLIMEKEGRIKEINRSFANLIDEDRGSIRGKNILDYVAPEAREIFARYINQHLEGEYTSCPEVDFIGKRGRRTARFSEYHVTIMENHLPVGVLISGVDITTLKNYEKNQAELEEKLRQASRMESLGLLAGGIAHDLKNILNPLIGYPDFLLKQLPPESPLRQPILRMKQSALRTSEIVQNLLALARRGRFEPGSVEINRLIEFFLQTIEFKEMQLRYPEVKVSLRLTPRLPPIEGSAAQLRQALMNLVRNAFEAMPDGGRLEISTFCRSLDYPLQGYQQIPRGTFNVIKISDEGRGMEKDEMKNLFEPFYSGKKMDHSGSGLGLSVVAGVVEDHRAYLDLHSRKGEGTTFFIYFPLKKKINNEFKEAIKYEKGSAEAHYNLGLINRRQGK